MATLHASSPSSPHSTYSSLSEEISLQQAASALLAWLDAHEPGEQMPQTSVKKVQALFFSHQGRLHSIPTQKNGRGKNHKKKPKNYLSEGDLQVLEQKLLTTQRFRSTEQLNRWADGIEDLAIRRGLLMHRGVHPGGAAL